ncbi:hypothetical protein QOZ99_001605 [Angulomicrobium amanitiforme]|uniref:Recombinase domain-containing protein n=1 Tax=Ancylobacter amanitiformis TaxID=217069 RepID=A0ABU0LPT1_9HYPH|nr:hypothetical protein [Ancylobacter amanitiformis]
MFADALDLHMRRHGDTAKHLARVLEASAAQVDATALNLWRRGVKVPRASRSLAALELIERRYRLPPGYFRSKLPNGDRCTSAGTIAGISRAERRRLAWHLPHDFDRRPLREREEILEWVQRVVITGTTDYRRFQAAAMKQRYSIRFPGLLDQSARPRGLYRFCREEDGSLPDPDLASAALDAPPQLTEEMADLVRFKTATLMAFGYQRSGVWGEETASQKVEHLGLMFGALAASPSGAVHGFGVPLENLSFSLLVFPIVWDWYIQWRERRRGFYTAWEVDMLRIAAALSRFFRDAFGLEMYIRRLAKHGVRLVSITQELGDDPAQVMMRQVIALFDEYQSGENAKHVLRAMKENARQGFYNGSRLPLGFTLEEVEKRGHRTKKRIIVDPVEAELVRLMFDLYRQGDGTSGPMGIKEITKHLNAKGYRTRLGARYGVGTIHGILTNPVYVGEWSFNKRSSKTGQVKPQHEVIPISVPAILERRTFDKVQKALRAKSPHNTATGDLGSDPADGACLLRLLRQRHDVAHRHFEERQGLSLLQLLDLGPGRQVRLQGANGADGEARPSGHTPCR